MDGTVTLRTATGTDADAIARVHVASWQFGYRGLVDDAYLDSIDMSDWAARTRSQLNAPDQPKEWLVTEIPGQVIGFVSFGPYRAGRDVADSSTDGEIHAIYVHPDRWGSGVGRIMLAAAVQRLTTRGLTPIRLWTLAGNTRTRRFYERYGFTTDAEGTFRLPHGDGEITLPTVRYTL